LKDGVRGIELIVECSLVVLLRDGLARHEAAWSDEQSSLSVKGGDCQDDLLCSVLHHPALTLLDET
jgi:hypothetical protein